MSTPRTLRTTLYAMLGRTSIYLAGLCFTGIAHAAAPVIHGSPVLHVEVGTEYRYDLGVTDATCKPA